jgi:phosphoribosylformimino-5-aminoimidazole carboxamide ribotide isomerase
MIIYPAIDLRDGNVVRLHQGDYDQMTVYSEDPLAVARSFQEAGATHLHVVDLDGARGGTPENFRVVQRLIQSSGLEVQVGGGIRNRERIETYLKLGAKRVILGTAALTDPRFLKEMVEQFGEAIAVGVDVKDGLAAINGWEETTAINGVAFCRSLAELGVKTVIFTDIAKDGGMQGTNLEVYRELARIPGLNIIASGGISFEEEIIALKDLVYGAILGKALYNGILDLNNCVRLAERSGK